MNNVALRGLMKIHNANRRSAAEQERELAHLRLKSYRGVPTGNTTWMKKDVHGTFTYRGVTYNK